MPRRRAESMPVGAGRKHGICGAMQRKAVQA
jgi:hypothetical protein